MGNKIRKCLIISGAPEQDTHYYHKYHSNRYIICADSGYRKCLREGIKPDLIIGDFDSSALPSIDCELISLQVRKDDTDTFHCVKEAVSRGYNDIIIVGGIGSRLDHTYANLLCLSYCKRLNVNCALVNSNNMAMIIDGENRFEKGEYRYFSLYALFEQCTNVTINGASYNADNIIIKPDDQFAQSNEFVDDNLYISIEKGKLLIFFCND